ncbi:MAG: DoxX family protein [Leptospirales bacterium]|nr:DoxX family protein [Leptospirales bacterium]
MRTFLETNGDITLTVIRVVLGTVMFAHGAQKLLGWFGGYGFKGTMGYLTGQVGLPSVVALLVIGIEFFGGLALVGGLGVRVVTVGVVAVMIGAVITAHLPNGFFMNWGGSQKGEGYEYHLIVLAASAALILRGGGKWSLDTLLVENFL